jgi:uncharacterized DUF497 family protein
MDPVVGGFQWDRGNRAKCQQHGVSIGEIEQLFAGPIAVFPDPAHSDAKERFKAIGRTGAGRTVLIVFAFRDSGGDRVIRPISARYMHRKEIAYYEEEIANAGERRGG